MILYISYIFLYIIYVRVELGAAIALAVIGLTLPNTSMTVVMHSSLLNAHKLILVLRSTERYKSTQSMEIYDLQILHNNMQCL